MLLHGSLLGAMPGHMTQSWLWLIKSGMGTWATLSQSVPWLGTWNGDQEVPASVLQIPEVEEVKIWKDLEWVTLHCDIGLDAEESGL